MISVVLLGGGNVAHHLTQAFLACKDVDLKQLYARNKYYLLLTLCKILMFWIMFCKNT